MAEDLPATVLLIEDRASIRKLLMMAFKQEGFAVELAGDGPSALQLIERLYTEGSAPKVVLLDVLLPDVEGTELIASVRRRDSAVPIIAMSGSRAALSEAARAGATHTVDKPFGLDEILDLVARYVRPHGEPDNDFSM